MVGADQRRESQVVDAERRRAAGAREAQMRQRKRRISRVQRAQRALGPGIEQRIAHLEANSIGRRVHGARRIGVKRVAVDAGAVVHRGLQSTPVHGRSVIEFRIIGGRTREEGRAAAEKTQPRAHVQRVQRAEYFCDNRLHLTAEHDPGIDARETHAVGAADRAMVNHVADRHAQRRRSRGGDTRHGGRDVVREFKRHLRLRGVPAAPELTFDDGRVGRPFAHLDEHVVEAPFDGKSDQPGREGVQQNERRNDAYQYFFQHSLPE